MKESLDYNEVDIKHEDNIDVISLQNNESLDMMGIENPSFGEIEEGTANNENDIIQEDIPDDYTEFIELINRSNFYLPERKELLEIVLQYNMLFDDIERLNNKLDSIKGDVLKANLLYDVFKRTFASLIDSSTLFDKLYYTLPLFDDFDDNDIWINKWCSTVQAAVTEENRNDIRNFINKNLYNSVYTLPKEVYCYKVSPKSIEGVNEEVARLVYMLASRMSRYIKYIKDTSDQLRSSMQKILTVEPIKTALDFGKVSLFSKEEIDQDLYYARSIRKESPDLDKDYDIRNKYKLPNLKNSELIAAQENFIEFARSTYQNVLDYQNRLNSTNKTVYTSSLIDIYRLYGDVTTSLNDINKLQAKLLEADEVSNLVVNKLHSLINEMLEVIERYLKESYNIKPLKEIQIGVNFNTLDVNWYDSSGAEPAPNKDLVECIANVSDIGFAKYNAENEVDFVTKPARIFVYSKQILSEVATEV